jgi:hypothetical protein
MTSRNDKKCVPYQVNALVLLGLLPTTMTISSVAVTRTKSRIPDFHTPFWSHVQLVPQYSN